MAKVTKFVLDGNDATGKSSVVAYLTKMYGHLYKFQDRGILTKLSDVYEDSLPASLPEDECTIVLDADIDVCMRRLLNRNKSRDKYDTYEAIFKYKNRFMRLAIKYQTYYVDTTHYTLEEVCAIVAGIVRSHVAEIIIDKNKYKLPNPDLFTEEMFRKLPLVAEGYSKIIRAIDEKYTLIEYKPTVYSHKQRREGIIPYTDQERMSMTRNILYIFDIEQIPHAYVYVGSKYVLCRRLDPKRDIPPVEVIVKKCCLGTDKHRYYWIEGELDRYGNPIVTNDNREYSDLVVRFDYRNPNHGYVIKVKPGVTEVILSPISYMPKDFNTDSLSFTDHKVKSPSGTMITVKVPNYVPEYVKKLFASAFPKAFVINNPDDGCTDITIALPHYIPPDLEQALKEDPVISDKRIGDEALCDDLADKFINVAETKKLALKTFKVLDKHFEKMGIYFQDVCFMIDRSGSSHFSEVSQDCGRYKKIDENGMTSYDKDLWRGNSSSETVHERWRQMTNFTKEYVKTIY